MGTRGTWGTWGKRTDGLLAWGRARPWAVDGPLLALAVGVSLWGVYTDGHPAERQWWAYALALAGSLPLWWRRRAPWAVLLACAVPTCTLSVLAHFAMPQIQVAMAVAVYTVADRGRDWQRAALLAFTVVGNVVGTRSFGGMLFSLVVAVGSFVLGSLVRELRRLAGVEAERARQAGLRAASDAARAVAEERARIAREMHDILAHAVSLMVVQAEAGPLVVRGDPDRAVRAFDAIADSGRDAMVQLRRSLGVLKEGGAAPALAPQPRLAELADVLQRVRDSGVAVDAEIEEAGPAEVQAAAFRIVQEALTNVVKHAGARRVGVRVAVRDGALLAVEVVDDGAGAGAGAAAGVDGRSGGRGLLSIRERAAACGGSAETGPRPDGPGYLVAAVLPLDA
ncbi:signal transduction histidine kinase [Kitasatospora sp. SolWspMP-SS2h]|uniref:sensor histidine kinase n=1 Tax=Kitasatospora sp. SolWspMP-SS2h TaxID=1305729 RepID=UPI000DBAC7B4|nr:histidine kinase [Kitasatospora sp. SolWspMP-SS2h]RAJ38821.1 signal transduction histidine kinase [Kitasatospora sp. SolWspMP-SS2h]